MIAEITGYSAAAFLSILFIPQVYKTFKTKDVNGLSYMFLFLQIITSALFITYGFLIDSIPVIIANTSTLLCNILLIFAKVKYKTST